MCWYSLICSGLGKFFIIKGKKERTENFTTHRILISLCSDAVVQGHDRVTQMETRLVVAEQSNRALLDEVLRLQGQLQSAVRASQDALAAERKSRDQLESVLIRYSGVFIEF